MIYSSSERLFSQKNIFKIFYLIPIDLIADFYTAELISSEVIESIGFSFFDKSSFGILILDIQ